MIGSFSKRKTLVLCILDGWGMAPDSPGNAITRANPQNFNRFWFSYPHTLLRASGPSVGLPSGTVGNSEVGHLNLGAGRIVLQDVLKIDNSISDGSFFKNEVFEKTLQFAQKNNSNIHLIGLVSSGSVHSKTNHLLSLLKYFQDKNFDPNKVKIHLITDGRDSPPSSAKSYVGDLENLINQKNLGQIASICGRYFAMDRDNRWDRTEKAYNLLLGFSKFTAKSAQEAIVDSYFKGITDEFIEPVIITDEKNQPTGAVQDNDVVIFFNFRADRARQLTKAFVLPSLLEIKTSSNKKAKTFDRKKILNNLLFVTFTAYEAGLPVSLVAFPKATVPMPLAEVFSQTGAKQLHIAETEKYAHVTYFFNGGIEAPFHSEERILVDSQKVASYDLSPEMSAKEITVKLISRIKSNVFDLIVVNFANADMVGHTGNLEAAIKAVQTVDFQLGQISKEVLAQGGSLIITADHGNAEIMKNLQTGEVDTEHNASPVPFIFIDNQFKNQPKNLYRGILADVAPTILSALKIPKPSQMSGRDLMNG